jgi:hypothetical protein
MKKTRSKKSCNTVPLKVTVGCVPSNGILLTHPWAKMFAVYKASDFIIYPALKRQCQLCIK